MLRRLLVVTVVSLCAHALDPMLVEFGWSQPNPVTLPANYVLLVDGSPWNGISDPAVTAYPTTKLADPSSIVFWNQNCANGSQCLLGFSNGGQQPTSLGGDVNLDRLLGGPNLIWADGWDGNSQPYSGTSGIFHATAFVPQLALDAPSQALKGYKITAVEREITATTQTIRLYGVVAPEPSALLLGLLACVPLDCRRGRR